MWSFSLHILFPTAPPPSIRLMLMSRTVARLMCSYIFPRFKRPPCWWSVTRLPTSLCLNASVARLIPRQLFISSLSHLKRLLILLSYSANTAETSSISRTRARVWRCVFVCMYMGFCVWKRLGTCGTRTIYFPNSHRLSLCVQRIFNKLVEVYSTSVFTLSFYQNQLKLILWPLSPLFTVSNKRGCFAGAATCPLMLSRTEHLVWNHTADMLETSDWCQFLLLTSLKKTAL